MKRNLSILFIALVCFQHLAKAQDIHFSQFFASPLTINPANTGVFDGAYRVGANYRQQWNAVPVPYRTFAVYTDYKFGEQVFNRYYFAAGLSIVSDRAGDGNLSVTKVMASGAFHYRLDKKRIHHLSVGIQTGWVQKRVDLNKLYFDDQWDERTFNKNILSSDQGYTSGFGRLGFQFGTMYTYKPSDKLSAYASVSTYNLTKAKDSFLDENNRLGIRPVFSGGATVTVNDKLILYPNLLYMSQKKASELLLGSLASYNFNPEKEDNKFYFGIYLRTKDAFYPVVGYEYHRIRMLFNYDINFSELKPATNGRGAWELSLVYTGASKMVRKVFDIPCPRY